MDSDKSELTFAHTAFRLGTLSGSIFRWYHPALPLSGESLLRHYNTSGRRSMARATHPRERFPEDVRWHASVLRKYHLTFR